MINDIAINAPIGIVIKSLYLPGIAKGIINQSIIIKGCNSCPGVVIKVSNRSVIVIGKLVDSPAILVIQRRNRAAILSIFDSARISYCIDLPLEFIIEILECPGVTKIIYTTLSSVSKVSYRACGCIGKILHFTTIVIKAIDLRAVCEVLHNAITSIIKCGNSPLVIPTFNRAIIANSPHCSVCSNVIQIFYCPALLILNISDICAIIYLCNLPAIIYLIYILVIGNRANSPATLICDSHIYSAIISKLCDSRTILIGNALIKCSVTIVEIGYTTLIVKGIGYTTLVVNLINRGVLVIGNGGYRASCGIGKSANVTIGVVCNVCNGGVILIANACYLAAILNPCEIIFINDIIDCPTILGIRVFGFIGNLTCEVSLVSESPYMPSPRVGKII